ncbi:cation-translocating P-type ATPase [Candidatus Roizmanbacteria bacterium]|nr:cation-translocating P-type ATPase [Candidatus Roizmanbacteria bacterium]
MNEKRSGLTSREAENKLAEFGTNELKDQKRTTTLQIFLHQFKNFLVLLLFVAAAISFTVGEVLDAGIIILILLINIALGFFQEFKAENAIAALKKLTATNVRVIRNGEEQLVDSRYLVPGDIIKLGEGDKVPADAKILASVRFEVNEAALTGESLPVAKSEKNADVSMVFMGTIVSSGRATVEIIKTGSQTKFGSLAQSLSDIDKGDTPLTHKITRLGIQVSTGAIIITAVLFVVGLLRDQKIIDMLLTSISLLVAAVPEGLPAVITITLAVGLQRMARQKAILRKLGAIEALGNTTVIATDKTGTLTENKMRVVSVWVNENTYAINELKKVLNNASVRELIRCGIICNDAHLRYTPEEGYTILGEQTEGSLLVLAKDVGIDPETVKNSGQLIDEFSFDPQKKIMSVLWQGRHTRTLYSKGAPENMLALSTHISLSGKRKKMTKADHEKINKAIIAAAQKGLRVLALAQKDTNKQVKTRDSAEKELTFLGLVGIADPPRHDVKEVIQIAREAGIKTIMITGDNPLTATYIGREIGLMESENCVVTGQQLAQMHDEELAERLETSCVFARTTPEDKYRIVRILQKHGHSVTVTGDGVNDALALKQANVGVAMGITGTDVAKEVSDMVITDDNFVSIVKAVREGRIIFDNIVKSITYLLACNLGEVMLIFIAIALGYPAPLLPVQILWINLVTDGLPALSLAFDPGSPMIMKRQSYVNGHYLLNKSNVWPILEFGGLTAFIPLAFYLVMVMIMPLDSARTVAFTIMVLTQMIIIFFIRTDQKFLSNKLLLISVALSLLLQYIIITFEPFKTIFHIGI